MGSLRIKPPPIATLSPSLTYFFIASSKGIRVGILTNSGGTGIELTDLCQENGLDVPELPADVQAVIKPMLLPFASPRNPIDITPDWTRFGELYYKCTAELLKCEKIDIVIPILLQVQL